MVHCYFLPTFGLRTNFQFHSFLGSHWKIQNPLWDIKKMIFFNLGKDGGRGSHWYLLPTSKLRTCLSILVLFKIMLKIDFGDNGWCFVDLRHWRRFSIVFNFNSLWVHFEKKRFFLRNIDYYWFAWANGIFIFDHF